MLARVLYGLKTESASKFLEEIEHEVVPLLRKQKGFLD